MTDRTDPSVEFHRAVAARRTKATAWGDAERLNWLERMANEPGGILLHDGTETGRNGLGLRPGSLKRTLRQAIDDAARPSLSQPKTRNER